MKGDVHEAGNRVPYIVRWPDVTEAGTSTDQAIPFTDVMAIFSDLLNTELPENADEDSFSLYPALTG